MKSRYKCGAGRAAALAALGASGALIAQGLTSGVPVVQSLNLRPGNYQLVTTTNLQLPPQAAAALSPEMLAQLKQPQTHYDCIADSDLAKGGELAGQPKDPSCRITQQSTSGNEMNFVMRCAQSTVRFHGTFAVNTYRATVLITSEQGKTTTVNLTAHRIGDCRK